ncbi:MAG: MarR family transcriptional regulator [Coriobacteriia bacterium]|nr:MarR family transcriptional regulator [Coriobacteriia bacterium]
MPHDSLPDALLDELDASVMMLGRMFAGRHSDACHDTVLSMPQMLMLRILHEAGAMRVGSLATALGIKAPATSSMVEALEERELIGRTGDPDDRRVSLVHATEAGIAQLEAAELLRRKHMRRYAELLGEDDVRALIRIHRTLIEAMVSERV